MKRLPRSLAVLVVLTVVIGLAALPAFAGDNEKDPPGRVARLKYMSGQVSFQPGGVNDWVDATLNRPLTTADRVWTDKDSKAELHLGSAALRMNSETSLTLSNLTDSTVQVELDQGVLNVHVRKMYDGEIYEVDTPNVAFTLLKPGDYRFEVNPDADTTTVIVRKGKGEGNGDGRGVQIEAGEMARFEHGNTLMHAIERAPGMDGFDDWCRVRDQREDRGYESARYVSDDVIGYEDLDDYGYWRPVPTYGYVWVPRHVVVGWAPYRYGHWVWVSPWGWTWVDDAPWGFAPFHYGRWVSSPYGWAWCPGPRVYRPVYAPALVAWFGGPHFGIGVGFGNVGWVPLGWGEPYYPWYRGSSVYVRNVNITNTHITNITYVTNNYNTMINHHGKPIPIQGGHYMNERGVSVVSNDAMIHSQRVDRAMQPWKGGDLRQAEFMHSPGVMPDKESVLGGGHEMRVPQGVSERRPVMSKLTPPERPVSFEDRRAAMEKNRGAAAADRNVESRGAGENRAPSAAPSGPRVPADRKPVEVGDERTARDNGHMVPRPPADRKPGTGDNGSSARDASNETTRHAVPRPPADRKPMNGGEDRTAGERSGNPQATPRVPEDRKPVDTGEDRRGSRTPDGSRRAVDAEARQNNVPKPPDHEVKNPEERRNAEPRREQPKREAAPKPKPQERESKPATPAGAMAWSGGSRNIPRPTADNPSRPAASYSRNDYAGESGYSRREVASAAYGREYGSGRSSYSGYGREAYSAPRSGMSSSRATSGYSNRSAGYSARSSAPRAAGHVASGGSYRSSGGGSSARRSGR